MPPSACSLLVLATPLLLTEVAAVSDGEIQPVIQTAVEERGVPPLRPPADVDSQVEDPQPSARPLLTPEESPRAGRKLKRLGRVVVPLLLVILLVKSGLGLPLIMSGVALAAFKGLWTGSTALVLTAALALRHLIPMPRVVVAPAAPVPHHHHYTDYVADYRRADEYRDDYSRYSSPGW